MRRICRNLCTSIGPRCAGFNTFATNANGICNVYGEHLTEDDVPSSADGSRLAIGDTGLDKVNKWQLSKRDCGHCPAGVGLIGGTDGSGSTCSTEDDQKKRCIYCYKKTGGGVGAVTKAATTTAAAATTTTDKVTYTAAGGFCVSADGRYTTQVFKYNICSGPSDCALKICTDLCTKIGPRCEGFTVKKSSLEKEFCFVHGEVHHLCFGICNAHRFISNVTPFIQRSSTRRAHMPALMQGDTPFPHNGDVSWRMHSGLKWLLHSSMEE